MDSHFKSTFQHLLNYLGVCPFANTSGREGERERERKRQRDKEIDREREEGREGDGKTPGWTREQPTIMTRKVEAENSLRNSMKMLYCSSLPSDKDSI